MTFIILFICMIFSVTTVIGFSNSSLCAREKEYFDIRNEFKENIHIRYDLSKESYASKYSLIEPVNKYNGARLNEIGRSISYIQNQKYKMELSESEINTDYLIYADYYSDYFTVSRFGLNVGSYEYLNEPNSIYISTAIIKKIPDLKEEDFIGLPIKLYNGDEYVEYIIRGIIRESGRYDSGNHFSNLFGKNYILFNPHHLYEYGFSDLMFRSTEDYFMNDSIDLINVFDKSYVNYQNLSLSISSYCDEVYTIKRNITPIEINTLSGVVISVITIVEVVVSLGLLTLFLFTYEFSKYSMLERVLICLTASSWGAIAIMISTLLLDWGIFIPRLAAVLQMVFLAIMVIGFILKFAFFHGDKRKVIEAEVDGK